jgi:hypothetical protein
MAWKKIIVSGSQAELNSLTVDNTLTANAFSGDGASITGVVHNAGEIASQISGSFTALSGSIATRFDGLTSDYTELTNIPSGIMSSSAQVEATLTNNDVDFGTGDVTANAFIGDGSQLQNITVDQSATVIQTFSNETSLTVTHNFGSKNVLATVYNSADEQIIPGSVTTTSGDVVTITFDTATSGRVIVGKGGHIVSGSIPFSNLLNKPTLVSSSAQISIDSVDGFTAHSSSVASRFDNLTSDYTELTNIPNGIVSSSAQIGLSSADSPQFNSLVLTGDLTVQGTTTSVQSTNLLVEDKFILLNSGSANPDVGGIVIDEGSGAGHAFIYNNTAGRFGYTGSLASDATSATPDAFGAAVVDIDAGHLDISEYQKNGNIKIDSGAIYIYS